MELFTLAGALVFGTLVFWAFWTIAVVAMFVLVYLAEDEHWAWATVLLAGAFIGLGSIGAFNLYAFTVDHPWQLVGRIANYLFIGCFWGAFKWWRFCLKQRKMYDEAKKDFLKSHGATELTPELRVEWTDKLKNTTRYDRYHVIAQAPEASDNKEKIMNWMYLWPFSVLGTFMSGFLRRIWTNIYEWMSGIYDSIAKSVWKGTENDLASEEDKKIALERNFEKLSPEEQRRRNNR